MIGRQLSLQRDGKATGGFLDLDGRMKHASGLLHGDANIILDIIIIVTCLESHTRCASRAHVVRLYMPRNIDSAYMFLSRALLTAILPWVAMGDQKKTVGSPYLVLRLSPSYEHIMSA